MDRLSDVQVDAETGLHIGTLIIGRQLQRVGIRPLPAGAVAAGPPLLLFNGIGANMELAAPLMSALDGVETLIFDLPGAGKSPPPRLPYRLFSMARLTRRLLDALGYGRVDVMGVSWGGGLAQQFAIQYPKRVRRLVLAATAMGGATHNPEAIKLFTDHARGGDAKGYRYQLVAMFGWASLPWLWRIRHPTLVLAGNDDPLVPLINARLHAWLLRDARLHVFDDGHLFLLTRTQETAATIAVSWVSPPREQEACAGSQLFPSPSLR